MSLRIAVLGHGEEGSFLAGALLAAGATVVGYDMKPPKRPTVPLAETVAEAVADADIVLSLNSTPAALRIAEWAAPSMKSGALFADLNPGTPTLKNKLAEIFPVNSFIDVAVMGSIADAGIGVHLIASGPATKALSEQLSPLGMSIEFVSENVGDAAARNLTKSILTKCLAGVVVDYMWAAQQMGLTDWAYAELQSEFDGMTAETARRYLQESGRHVKRNEIEMLDVVEMLEHADYHSLFVPPTQLVYNKIYHSIPVPFSEPEDE